MLSATYCFLKKDVLDFPVLLLNIFLWFMVCGGLEHLIQKRPNKTIKQIKEKKPEESVFLLLLIFVHFCFMFCVFIDSFAEKHQKNTTKQIGKLLKKKAPTCRYFWILIFCRYFV
jgi:hypothetical protein